MKTVNMKTLIVSVVCLMLLSTAMLQLSSAASTNNTKMLLWEDFESNRNLKNVWSFVSGVLPDNVGGVTSGGSWKVVDDGTGNRVYQAQSEVGEGIRGTAAFAGDTRWKDYTIEARTLTTDSHLGLIVCADSTGTNYYDVYVTVWKPDTTEDHNTVSIEKHTNGIWGRTQLSSGSIPKVIQNTWIDIKVVVSNEVQNGVSGTLVKVFCKLDGPNEQYPSIPQATTFDTTLPFTSGRIGLLFYDENPTEMKYAWYDNVIVTANK